MATTKRLNKTTLARLRRELEAEREQLLAQANELDATAVVGMWRDGGVSDDDADTGTATSERERAQSLALNARRILVQIDDALRRMGAGTYGLCERCGKPIEPARLEALPYATLCLADKQLDERIF
ncbi:MAG: TraR/DksA C4-type zinc finger protein [Actinobacteria bacterium]|nr:TraR/DksA C4-type zinc finger protein [Actinomycetota bacterium]